MDKPFSKKVRIDVEIRGLIPGYLDHRAQDILELRQALSSENFDRVAEIGHKVKGSGPSYGFEDLGRIGEQLEQAAKAGNTREIEQQIQRWEDYLATVEIEYIAFT